MKYKLYSAVNSCAPCRALVNMLDKEFPQWKDSIEYINADELTEEQWKEAEKLGVRGLPTLTDDEKIIFTGFSPDKVKTLITELSNEE